MFKQSFASRCVDSFGVSPDNVGWRWIYYTIKVNVRSLTLSRQEQASVWQPALLRGADPLPVGAGRVAEECWGCLPPDLSTDAAVLPFKGSQAQPRVTVQLSPCPKSPLAWEEEEGERGGRGGGR